MTDRRAFSLTQLVDQCNAHAPTRNKASDGWIGDASHQNRNSDHNPWIYDEATGDWVVSAQDITNDPAAGMASQELAELLVKSKDARIKYIISNKKICSGTGQSHPAWVWRPYTGSNPHSQHVHISVKDKPNYYDDDSPWGKGPMPPVTRPPPTAPPNMPVLRRGSQGPAVEMLQRELNAAGYTLRVDGDFGPNTEKAVLAFQYRSNLVVDGIVGPYTWQALAAD
jgi:hypothetical protein